MIKNNYKRSRTTRFSWMGLAVFFIIFCSCPMKRFFKLQLYKDATPAESSSNNLAFSKELKDCNLIEKRSKPQVITVHNLKKPDPKRTDILLVGLVLVSLPPGIYYNNDEDRKKLISFLQVHPPQMMGTVPLYLRCRRLQV